jgi:hypothetical protein
MQIQYGSPSRKNLIRYQFQVAYMINTVEIMVKVVLTEEHVTLVSAVALTAGGQKMAQ